MIKVQQGPFDAGAELAQLRDGNNSTGATAMFIGTVREGTGADRISEMALEHYPGMTEKALSMTG